MQLEQAKLAAALRKQLIRDQEAGMHAHFRAYFVKEGKSVRFVLSNLGDATARNVRLAAADPSKKMPILGVEETFPISVRPRSPVTLIAAPDYDTPMPFPIIMTWDDDAGDNQQSEIKVNYGSDA